MGAISRREEGQAAVEAAIVLPLFLFLVLGILQYTLMTHARILAKYAAYRAVRAGALHHASVERMEESALGALLPLLSEPNLRIQGEFPTSAEIYAVPTTAGEYAQKLQRFLGTHHNGMPDVADPSNRSPGSLGRMKYVEVAICGPLAGDVAGDAVDGEVDFDDPRITTGDDPTSFGRTKLRVQLTFNYRMPIPFANWIIHKIWLGLSLPNVVRLQSGGTDPGKGGHEVLFEKYFQAASQSPPIYVFPIRASYTMRMQSNLFLNRFPLPRSNDCFKF